VESVRHYRWVRDHKELGDKYFEPAALSIVQANQEAVAQTKAAGQLVEPPLPTAEVLKQSPAALEIPTLYKDLQTAYDEYMVLIHDEKTAPKMALASAMISYRHQQSDDALRRFDVVLKQFCKSPEAVQAKDGLLVIYEARSDDKKFQDVNDLFIDSKCGEDKDIEIAKRQNMTKSYEIASKLYKDNKFPEAGAAFYAIYKTAPDDDENRDDELFSAAVAFEKAGKPKTAIAIYQEFSKVAEFKKSEYFVESLYRTAVSYQSSFDYESAVDVYLQVAALAAEPGRKAREGFDLQKTRLDAMWNAAFLREMDRVYYDRSRNDPGAATLYRNYSSADTTDRQRSREAFFRAAMVYEKAGDTKNMMKAFADWRKAFGQDEGAGYFVVLSQHKTAKALESQRDKKGTEEYYRQTIKSFDDTKEAPGSPSAELAGEAQFWLAEKTYAALFEPYKVKWKGSLTGKNAEKVVTDTLDSLQKVAVDTAAAYLAVARFESSWSLAASVRLGDVAFFAGQKLLEAPVPKEILDADTQFPDQGVLASYQQQLEDQTKPQTEDGKNFWTKAVDSAKKAGVSNDWSKLAQQRLNAYIASDLYPVQRDELIDREMNP
jgi:TolA-binding protein